MAKKQPPGGLIFKNSPNLPGKFSGVCMLGEGERGAGVGMGGVAIHSLGLFEGLFMEKGD